MGQDSWRSLSWWLGVSQPKPGDYANGIEMHFFINSTIALCPTESDIQQVFQHPLGIKLDIQKAKVNCIGMPIPEIYETVSL